jgi:hypothetical protein
MVIGCHFEALSNALQHPLDPLNDRFWGGDMNKMAVPSDIYKSVIPRQTKVLSLKLVINGGVGRKLLRELTPLLTSSISSQDTSLEGFAQIQLWVSFQNTHRIPI